ncbi:MAG: molybdenum cofactor guanylyltransferase [Planctomycetaceae bacterium]|nr:molybdenum cofactor guanylyltransferase [Planctomycetaceae bacterium]
MSNGESTRTGGLVLCGGGSRRMGSPKYQLRFGDETMLERMVRLLSSVVSPVAVIASAGQELPALQPEVIIARDLYANAGPLAGLSAGLNALSHAVDAVYVTSCDSPFLHADFVRAVISSLGTADMAIPRDRDHHHPLAAVYRTSLAPTVDRLLSEGIRRPVALLESVTVVEVDVAHLRPSDPDLRSLQNMNTPNDYQDALRAAGLLNP